MLNRILIFGGIALAAILIVENYVVSSGTAYIFLWYGNAGELVIITFLIGICVGYGLKSFYSEDDANDDNYDF